MKRTVMIILAFALALSLILAACGTTQDKAEESPNANVSVPITPDDPENVPSDLNADDTADNIE